MSGDTNHVRGGPPSSQFDPGINTSNSQANAAAVPVQHTPPQDSGSIDATADLGQWMGRTIMYDKRSEEDEAAFRRLQEREPLPADMTPYEMGLFYEQELTSYIDTLSSRLISAREVQLRKIVLRDTRPGNMLVPAIKLFGMWGKGSYVQSV